MSNQPMDIKTYLLTNGYSGEGEDDFDAILKQVRAGFPDFLPACDDDGVSPENE